MESIFHEKFNRKISKEFTREIEITQEGLYLIEISAKCRSEIQISPKETDDDDLRIEIDGRKFPILKAPARYLDYFCFI